MARIVALLEGKQDRELLDQWLSQYHLLSDYSPDAPIDETADLCIVDGPSLIRLKDQLQARRDFEQPGFFPVLLLTPRRDVWAREALLQVFLDAADALGRGAGRLAESPTGLTSLASW